MSAFFDSKGFDLLCTISFTTPHAIESEIPSEPGSAELRRKALSAFDCRDDLGLGCAAFIRTFSSVRMKLNGCNHSSPHTSTLRALMTGIQTSGS